MKHHFHDIILDDGGGAGPVCNVLSVPENESLWPYAFAEDFSNQRTLCLLPQ